MSPRRFHVKRHKVLRTLVRSLIGPAVAAIGVVLLAGWARGTLAYQLLAGALVLVCLWWGLR